MEAKEQNSVPLRPTGHMERLNIIRSSLNFYNNVGTTATYNIPTSALPALSALESKSTSASASLSLLLSTILEQVVAKQPIMGVAIDDDKSLSPQWKRLDSYNFSDVAKVVVVGNEEGFENERWIQDEHNTPFEDVHSRPLWRVVAVVKESSLPSSTTTTTTGEQVGGPGSEGMFKMKVGFFFHHAIGDGISGAAFHLTFLEALNSIISCSIFPPATPSELGKEIAIPVQELIPNLEAATPLPLTLWYMIKVLFRQFIYSPHDPKLWLGPPVPKTVPADNPIQCTYTTFHLPHTYVSSLLSICRHEKTTITSLLNVLVARRLAVLYPKYTHFISGCPISLRRFGKGYTAKSMGVFISGINITFSSDDITANGHISCKAPNSNPTPTPTSSNKDVAAAGSKLIAADDKSLWESARACREAMATQSSSPANQVVGMLKFIAGDMKSFFLGKLGGSREASFEISNIGVVDGGCDDNELKEERRRDAGGKATFDRIMFSASASAYGSPYVFSVASAKGGDLTVSLKIEDGVVSVEDSKDVMDWLKGALIEIAEAQQQRQQ